MDRTEIIERLKNIAEHAVHTVGERPFIMSLDDGIAVHEAIELLEKAETVEAIPVDWLMQKADWCDKNNGIFVSGAIRSAVDAWREEQNNGIDKP